MGPATKTPSPHQRSRTHPRGNFALHLLGASKKIRVYAGLKLAELGLHPGQDEILTQLQGDRAVSVTELADILRIRPSTVSKSIDKLIASEFVERVHGNSDKRTVLVLITPVGLDMQARIRNVWQRAEEDLFGKVAPRIRNALTTDIVGLEAMVARAITRARGRTPASLETPEPAGPKTRHIASRARHRASLMTAPPDGPR